MGWVGTAQSGTRFRWRGSEERPGRRRWGVVLIDCRSWVDREWVSGSGKREKRSGGRGGKRSLCWVDVRSESTRTCVHKYGSVSAKVCGILISFTLLAASAIFSGLGRDHGGAVASNEVECARSVGNKIGNRKCRCSPSVNMWWLGQTGSGVDIYGWCRLETPSAWMSA
jgi:hypothetical protein